MSLFGRAGRDWFCYAINPGLDRVAFGCMSLYHRTYNKYVEINGEKVEMTKV